MLAARDSAYPFTIIGIDPLPALAFLREFIRRPRRRAKGPGLRAVLAGGAHEDRREERIGRASAPQPPVRDYGE